MKTFQHLILSCLCLFLTVQAFAQAEEQPSTTTKTTIIIKTIDENGVEKTKKIVKEGPIDFDLDDEEIDVEVEVIDGDKFDYKDLDIFIKKAKDGIFSEDGTHFEFHSLPHHSWIQQNNCDKAFLGILMTKSIQNVNGVETITGETAEGVFIDDVIEGTGAEDAGLLAKDILVSIDGKAMKTMDDVIKEIQSHEVNDQITVAYLRDGQQAQTVATLKGKKCNETKNLVIEIEEEDFVPSPTPNPEVERIMDEIMMIKKKKDEERQDQQAEEAATIEDVKINTAPQNKQSLDLDEIDVFPNPSNGWINLNFRGTAKATTVNIVDVSGKVIYKEELPLFNGNYRRQIDIRKAAKGTLFLNVVQGEKIHTEKIIFN